MEFSFIPPELLVLILKNFNLQTLVRMEMINKQVRQLVRIGSWMQVKLDMSDTDRIAYIMRNYRFGSWTLRHQDLKNDCFSGLKKCLEIALLDCIVPKDGLKKLKKCQKVYLADSKLDDMDDLRYLQNCHTIMLHYREINDTHMRYFKNCYQVNLSFCQNITDDGIRDLNCRILYLYFTHKITIEGLMQLTNCHTLHLYQCDGITKGGIENLRKKGINVKIY